MNKGKELPTHLRKRRLDLSEWIWHFVRRDDSPKDTLKTIIKSNAIQGSVCRPFQEKIVCFTETPLFFHIQQDVDLKTFDYKRLSLYGLGFSRKYLYEIGARPVIYTERKSYDSLPTELKYLFVEFDLSKGIDFTWQREWRVKSDLLSFSNNNTVLVFPDHNEFQELLYDYHADFETDDDGATMACAGYEKKWNFIPLDFCDSFTYDNIIGYIDEDFYDDLEQITYDAI
jgi:hypothetical protein